jgi:WD40 repeat protein
MAYVNPRGTAKRRYNIRLYLRPACRQLFTALLVGGCLSPVAVVAAPQIKLLRQSSKPIVAVRFTPSGALLAASRDDTVSMWLPGGDRPLWTIRFQRPPRKYDYTDIDIDAMDVSPDGHLAAVAYLRSGVDRNLVDEKAGDPMNQKDGVWEPHIALIDTADGTIKKDIQEVRDNPIRAVIFAATGKQLFVTTATRLAWTLRDHQPPASMTHVLSVDTGQELRSFSSQGWIASTALSPDGKLFAAAAYLYGKEDTAFYSMQIYYVDTGQLLYSSKFETARAVAIGFSPDSRLLAVAGSAPKGMPIDLIPSDGSKKLTQVISAARPIEIRGVAFVGEQRLLALAGGELTFIEFDDVGSPWYKDQGGSVMVIDQKTGKTVMSREFNSFVTSLAISPDGARMAVGMYNGQIAITSPR